MMLDADEIIPYLFQGAAPRDIQSLKTAGIEVVVFCAREIQPPSELMPGFLVYRCPLDDNGKDPSVSEMQLMSSVVSQVAKHVRRGQRTLVSCAMGLNRSGVVTALAVKKLTGASGKDVIRRIKSRRSQYALCNEAFTRIIVADEQTSRRRPRR